MFITHLILQVLSAQGTGNMGHYAKVENGIVTEVITAESDYIETLSDSSLWIQTSYNTREGVHYEVNSNTPSADQNKALRKNYAGIGFTYDSARDAFIPPKDYPSWVLNENSCVYEAPLAKPSFDDAIEFLEWDEDAYQADNTQGWVLVSNTI